MYIGSGVGFFAGVLGAALHRGTEEPQLAPNQQTGLRLACNLCKHLPLRQWMQTHNAALMDRFALCCSSTNKSVRFAFATFMLNLSVFFSTVAKADAEGQAQVSFSYCYSSFAAFSFAIVSSHVCEQQYEQSAEHNLASILKCICVHMPLLWGL